MTERIDLNLQRKPVGHVQSQDQTHANNTNPIEKKTKSIGEKLSAKRTESDIKTTKTVSDEPKLAEYGIDLDKPFKITEEMVKKMKAKGKKGFWESLKDGAKNAIPFVSGAKEIYDTVKLLAIVKKQENGAKLTKKEKETLYLYLLEQAEQQHRGSSFMGKVGDMLSHMPAFAGEFLFTGGIYSLGKTAAIKTITKVAGEITKQQVLKYTAKKVAGVAVGAAARTFVLSNTYSGIVQRRLDLDTSKLDENGLGKLDLKSTKESWAASIRKGLLDGYIESLSEQSGETLMKPVNKLFKPFAKVPFFGSLLAPPPKTANFMARAGFHGMFEEYVEERFDGVLRALTGLADENKSTLENLKDAILPGWEQTGVELTTNVIWGGTISNGHALAMKNKYIRAFAEKQYRSKIFQNLNETSNKGQIAVEKRFTENVQPDEVIIKELSDKEFVAKKAELLSKMKHYDALKNIEQFRINKYNCQLLERILNHPELLNNENFTKNVGLIIKYTDTEEKAEAKKSMIKEMVRIKNENPELWNNENFTENVGEIIRNTYSKEQAEAKKSMIKETERIKNENPELWNNANFAKNVGLIIKYTYSKEEAEASKSIIKEILRIKNENPELWNNANFAKNVGEIIKCTNSQEQVEFAKETLNYPELWNNENFAKNIFSFVHKLYSPESASVAKETLNHPELWNNENFAKNLFGILYSLSSPKSASVAKETLNHPELWNNENFAKNLFGILYSSSSPESASIAKEALNHPELWNNENFAKNVEKIISCTNSQEQVEFAKDLLKNYEKYGIPANVIITIILDHETISVPEVQKLCKNIGKDNVAKLSDSDFILACKFVEIVKKNNINEISTAGKKALLRNLVENNDGLFEITDELKKYFPLIPKNQKEYCSLLSQIVCSLGIETEPLTPEQRIALFNSSMNNLSQVLTKISDADFAAIKITQKFSKDEFIKIVLEKVKDLSDSEKQKVYDYFGFELHENNKTITGYSITGYPVNLNNGKKFVQIENEQTKAVVEALRGDVIIFSKNNHISCNNKEVEAMINQLVDALPELRTTIGRTQHGTHDFDVMKHSLKVMQKISQDANFEKLNESDKKIMLLASLLHDITKAEGHPDKTHANESSFDTFFIAKKFKLRKEEEIKLYAIIRHHEWLQYVNTTETEEDLTKSLKSVAYDLQQDNLFDMALMFTHADLKAVKANDSFHNQTEGKGHIDFNGNVRSFGQSADYYAQKIRGYIKELQKSQPILPVTKLPNSARIKQAITKDNPDGSTNIKGVYQDKDGLIIIRFNEVEDFEAIGFDKGSTNKGYTSSDEERETGNIKFFVHGLEYANQLSKFDAFSLVDSDALLSVSYAEAPETKYKFFRPQGVILDVDTKYIHGGGETDSGSGRRKDINEFKNDYAYEGSVRYTDRIFVADMIKKATGMTDSEYVEFVKNNANKPMSEIDPKYRDIIIKELATIKSSSRLGNRSYNEMYISNPSVMGVFAYSMNDNIGNSAIEFVEQNMGRLGFLKKFALEKNIPLVIFGK